MPEKQFEIINIGVDYVCDVCGVGTMSRDQGEPMLLSNPPKIPHKCSHCGHKQHFTTGYPATGWQRKATGEQA